jgi:hypothetical protein
MGVRVILQTGEIGRLGIVFDDNGVRGISIHNVENYIDDKPCCLLVSADGLETSPSPEFDFCTAAIVVTSPNLKSKRDLNAWWKQAKAKRFVAT